MPLGPFDRQIKHSHWSILIPWLRELPKPVGILAFDDVRAYDLSEACVEAHIAVPDDVAIMGINNDELVCELRLAAALQR